MPNDHVLMCFVQWGFAGIVGICLLEKFVPIIPSYVLLFFLGFVASQDSGALVETAAATVVGSLAGSVGWYGIGRLIGEARVERMVGHFGRYILLRPSIYDRIKARYRSSLFFGTLLGHTIPTVRIFISLPAGVLHAPFFPFMMAALFGTLVWNIPLLSAGYLLGGSGLELHKAAFLTIAALVTIELTVAVVVAVFRRSRRA